MSASDSAFAAAVDAGALSLVTELTEDTSDVLLQLNALDLLEQVRVPFPASCMLNPWIGFLACLRFAPHSLDRFSYMLVGPGVSHTLDRQS